MALSRSNGEKQIIKWTSYLRLKINCISHWEIRLQAILHYNTNRSLVLIFHNKDFRVICFHQNGVVSLLHTLSFSPSVVTIRGLPTPAPAALMCKKNILDFSECLNIMAKVLLHSAKTEMLGEHSANVSPVLQNAKRNHTRTVYYQHLTCFSVLVCLTYIVYFCTVECSLLQKKNNNQLYINHERSFLVANARSIDQVIFVSRNESHY